MTCQVLVSARQSLGGLVGNIAVSVQVDGR